MPFAGKSTAARRLSAHLNIPVFSTDVWVEEEMGMTINEIFKTKGEIFFRKKEREALMAFLEKTEPFILDTGGGLPCFYDNMDRLNQKTLTVWLDVPVKELAERSIQQRDRPLLQGLSGDLGQRENFLGNLRFERLPYYSKAQWLLKSDKGEDLWIKL
jgi:shikimate kinase